MFSFANDNQTFTINGKMINFHNEKELQITASEKCIKKNNKCSNFSFLDKLSHKKLQINTNNSERLRVEICSLQLNGIVSIGTDNTENQNSFCFLKDKNLYIDIGTLNYYAKKNDGVASENIGFSKKRRVKP
jgi:hypothetical protein